MSGLRTGRARWYRPRTGYICHEDVVDFPLCINGGQGSAISALRSEKGRGSLSFGKHAGRKINLCGEESSALAWRTLVWNGICTKVDIFCDINMEYHFRCDICVHMTVPGTMDAAASETKQAAIINSLLLLKHSDHGESFCFRVRCREERFALNKVS